ncbi:TRAP transporter small permease [Aquamicrobium sp. LC103]|uniref:TRAP transporter small permease n=1 Tax=Aquamicrobium sp. LC103 TaxID=1120658 RepID=UPI00063EA985|nr:TRAP transporter small permease [Aquamicrobium sp. LC103]TKT74792.1 TRAP transporter small permease [Aquamicrobium sp. LC103]
MTTIAEQKVPSGPVRAGTSLLMIAGIIAMIAMMLHICADVLSRRLLGTPIVGTLEYVTYFYMVAVVFLPLGRVQEERGHVIVEVISQLMPPKVSLWVDRGAQLFTLAYVAFIGWWGWQETVRSFTRNEVVTVIQTDFPLWPTRLLVPLGLAAMCLVILAQLAESFRSGFRLPPPDPAAH